MKNFHLVHLPHQQRFGGVNTASFGLEQAQRVRRFHQSFPEYSVTPLVELKCLAKELGVKPMATWVGGALGGVDPSIMGVGPVAAVNKLMKKLDMKVADMDLIEANEAFAAQSLAVGHDLGFDPEKLNVNGGAIALGHPVGASGCRILVTLLHEMQRRDAKTGLATLCIGGGMGCATVVKRD